MENPFKKGDRVRLNAKGRHIAPKGKEDRTGTIPFSPRRTDRVQVWWDGTKLSSRESFFTEYLELVP